MRRQRTSAARLQLVEPLAPIPPQRLVIGYSLAEQQSLDPIDVLDPLVGQRLALTAKSAAVFFLWRRRPDHGADTRFTVRIAGTICARRELTCGRPHGSLLVSGAARRAAAWVSF